MSDIPSGALDGRASPGRSACWPASSCRGPANRSTSASSTSRNPTPTPAARTRPTRTTLEIGAESEVSFATYFNAFPASYWRRWSTLESVVLRVELTGSARVDVYRSKATGARITVGGAPSRRAPRTACPPSWSSRSSSTPFEDGGWIWFDITTDAKVDAAQRGLVRADRRARGGPTSRSASRPSTGRRTASTRWPR